MSTLTFTFRNAEEANRCDLTRLGVVAAVSGDGLTVKVEDVDLGEWREDGDGKTLVSAALRAAMASCGVWAKVS